MGRTHLRALAGLETVVVTAIADPMPQTRSQVSETGLPVYASVADMLAAEAIDGLLIAAPSDQHLQIIKEVAPSALPVLCEKPCGVSSGQAMQAARIAADAGVRLQVAYWRRYVPALRKLRDQIRDGGLGAVHLVSCYQWDERPPSAEFRSHSGGIAVDMGVHEFDQLRWLSGQDITTLTATASGLLTDPDVSGDVDSAQIMAELSGGAIGFVSLGRHHPAGDMARAEVFGTGGFARSDFLDPSDGERAQLEALREQAAEFARYARGAACTGASAADAVAALAAAEQATAAIPALASAGVPQ